MKLTMILFFCLYLCVFVCTADIQITYTGYTDEQILAFEHATYIWERYSIPVFRSGSTPPCRPSPALWRLPSPI
jgi:hypothetical protein